MLIFFFKQKTAYEMRISDWSSDVCSSDLHDHDSHEGRDRHLGHPWAKRHHDDEQKDTRDKSGEPPATAISHVAHRLTDHPATGNAAEQTCRKVGQAQSGTLARLGTGDRKSVV